ncbi:hypothetical protein [Psychrobacter phenylpyruvicus]|uniref:Chemotaxis protein n=1 Tax=Psychrobacter phenylpyruvicus TaxID=29432 RepID=A0A379LH32_9GAMM|nr:hypothetical protein [Psychrobacter phenylpyruvicus]SUD89909.1 Uncharacterised protein [Psychrobacter phenylpyruvicus]
MKLILKEYLSSLKERGELDAILPDLLSQMGLNIITTPRRGVKEYGVDIAAVGSIDGEEEKLYLLSVKAGDLTRETWNGSSNQVLRPSLDEILDAYIPSRIPSEHQDKPIEICLCFGGEVHSSIRQEVSGYINRNSSDTIDFSEWNGDKIADLILKNFFNGDLAPESYRSLLRKSIAMLDEPDTSIQYYKRLVDELCSQDINNKKDVINILRQLNIYTWMLFAWSRDTNNLESAYICAEYVLLRAWDISKIFLNIKGKNTDVINGLIYSLITLHLTVTGHYIDKVVVPASSIYLGLSRLVAASCAVDVNLKLFDLLGRVSLMGVWTYHQYCLVSSTDNNEKEVGVLSKQYHKICEQLILMIKNNDILLTPYKDEQAIDIMLAVFCLSRCEQYFPHIESWLQELVYFTNYNFATNQTYLSNIQDYEELIRHPLESTEEYREKVTKGSTLLPFISLVASIYDFKEVYSSVQKLHNDFLNHTNIQLYFFDDESEEFLYSNKGIHGASLSGVDIQQSADNLFDDISDECKLSNDFTSLSAIKHGLYPIVLMACRHYRLPFPVHMIVQSKNH